MALTALVQRATAGVAVRGAWLVALGVFGAALFYGDSVITPAISVLSAVEGLKVAAPAAVASRRAARARDPDRPVRRPALGHRRRRARVRAGDGRVVRRHRGDRRPARWPRTPTILRGLAPTLRRRVRRRPPGCRVRRDGRRHAGDHGRGGALRRHGPLRPSADPPGVVLAGVPGADAELPGAVGRSSCASPAAIENPFFLLAPALVAHPDGAAGDGRHGDRLPGRHLRRVLGLAPGRPARLPASPHRPPHVPAHRRPDLRAGWSTGRCSSPSSRSSSASAPPSGSAAPTASPSAARSSSPPCCSSPSRAGAGTGRAWKLAAGAAVFLPIEATFLAANLSKIQHGGWLPLRHRRRRLHAHDDVAPRQRDRQRQPHAPGGPAARVRRRAARDEPAAATGPRHRGLPQPVQGDDAAGAARERRAQPRAARARRDPQRPAPLDVPRVADGDRVTIDDLGFDDDNIAHVTARFGFQEQPNVPLALRLAGGEGPRVRHRHRRPDVLPLPQHHPHDRRRRGCARWRKRLFAVGHNVADPVDYFGLPLERTIIMGSHDPAVIAVARSRSSKRDDDGSPSPPR